MDVSWFSFDEQPMVFNRAVTGQLAEGQSAPSWFEILGVSPDASEEEIREAYRASIRLYHSDRVAGLGKKLQIVADEESKKINNAFEEARRQLNGRR